MGVLSKRRKTRRGTPTTSEQRPRPARLLYYDIKLWGPVPTLSFKVCICVPCTRTSVRRAKREWSDSRPEGSWHSYVLADHLRHISEHADHKASHILSCIMHPQKGVAELRWQNWQTANSHESLNAHDATLSDVTQHRCRCTAAARCSESSAAVTDKAARAAYRVHVRPRTLWQQSHEHSGHSQRPPVSPFSIGCLFWQHPVVGACVRSFRTLYERIQGLSACLDSREPEHRDASNLLASPPRGLPRTCCRTGAARSRSGDAADRQVTCGSTSCRWRRFVCVDAVIKNQGP